jgi:hypothetical protein
MPVLSVHGALIMLRALAFVNVLVLADDAAASDSVSSACLCAILVCTRPSKSPWYACMAGSRYRTRIVLHFWRVASW